MCLNNCCQYKTSKNSQLVITQIVRYGFKGRLKKCLSQHFGAITAHVSFVIVRSLLLAVVLPSGPGCSNYHGNEAGKRVEGTKPGSSACTLVLRAAEPSRHNICWWDGERPLLFLSIQIDERNIKLLSCCANTRVILSFFFFIFFKSQGFLSCSIPQISLVHPALIHRH